MENIRMLIVDDVAQVRKDLRMVLTLSCDVEVAGEAANGQEAISQAEILRPDVILMDLEMPVLDGYLATRQIKNLHPSLKIIALTVHGYSEAKEKALQAGVDAFFVKGEPLECLVQEIMKRKA